MLVLVGHSASGKTEIANELRQNYDIDKIITYTTRKPRVGEVNKVDYNFVSEKKFLRLMKEGFFAETTYFNGCYYGTCKKDISDYKVIILDPQGLISFKRLNIDNIFAVFLEASEEVRIKRMRERGDDEENIVKRIHHDRQKFSPEKLDYIDEYVNTNVMSISFLAGEVHKLYSNFLSKNKKITL